MKGHHTSSFENAEIKLCLSSVKDSSDSLGSTRIEESKRVANATETASTIIMSIRAHAGAGKPGGPSSPSRVKVLLAEDRPDTSRLIRGFLNRRIYEVDVVQDGESAVREFAAGQYDVVLMDIGLPIVDGCTATRQIREWERQSGLQPTPIIALTGYVAEPEIEECLAAGASLHIGKPVRRTTLLEFIRWTVSRKKGTAHRSTPLMMEIPAERSEALTRFIHERKQAAIQINALLVNRDFHAIKAIANDLKNEREGGEFLDLVIELIRALDQAASREDASDLESLTALLTEYLDRLSVVSR